MGPRKSWVEEVTPRTLTTRRDGQPSGPQRVGGRSVVPFGGQGGGLTEAYIAPVRPWGSHSREGKYGYAILRCRRSAIVAT